MSVKKTIEDFKRQVFDVYDREYVVLDNYFYGSDYKIKVMHNTSICNHIYDVFPNNLIRKLSSCPKCFRDKLSNLYRLDVDIIRDFCKNINYKLISTKYRNAHIKLDFECDNNHTFNMNFNNLSNGQRCPYCTETYGERYVHEFLDKLDYSFVYQYSFNDCIYKIRPMRFDFAVFNLDGSLKYLIEYDGEMHFFPIFGQKDLIETIERDKIKNEYCKSHNIDLIRISYLDKKNINSILCQYFIND